MARYVLFGTIRWVRERLDFREREKTHHSDFFIGDYEKYIEIIINTEDKNDSTDDETKQFIPLELPRAFTLPAPVSRTRSLSPVSSTQRANGNDDLRPHSVLL